MCNSPKKKSSISDYTLTGRLTWHKDIFIKRKQLGITLTKMYWLLGRKSKHSTSNKLLIHEIILKPIWTYRIQLWDTASTSIIEISERFESNTLRIIVDASWYVPNTVIRRDLQIQLKKKSAATALNTMPARVHNQMS
jgi:hypothetical protein